MKPKTRTWPSGVMGTMRMMAKGMKVRRSRAVRRSAVTCCFGGEVDARRLGGRLEGWAPGEVE